MISTKHLCTHLASTTYLNQVRKTSNLPFLMIKNISFKLVKVKLICKICSLNLQRRSVTVTYMCTHVCTYLLLHTYVRTYICTHCILMQGLGRPAHSTYTCTQTLMYILTYTHTHLDLKELEVLVRRGRWEYPHQLSTPPYLQCTPYTNGEERCMEMDETWSQEMEQNGSDTTQRKAPYCT